MGRYRNVSILAAAIFLQIVGLAYQVKRHTADNAGSTRLIRAWTVSAVTPLEKIVVRAQTGTTDIWHNYFYLRGVRQQNRVLQQQIQDLQLEQVRLRQDAEQARRLQTLLGFKEQFIDKPTAAQVIGLSGSEQSRLVYLDKGSSDGIGQDMAVISSEGIVGKAIQVFRHTSQVLLINDQTSGVGTILERTRLQGVLKGTPSGELVLDKIMTQEDVKPGDRVLTSGGDQIFPKGLPVGTVESVTRGSEFLQVKVRPSVALNHLEEVLVITKKAEREPAIASSAPVRAADILAQRLPSVPDQPPASKTVPASGAQNSATPGGTAKPTVPSSPVASNIPAAAPVVRATNSAASTEKPTGSTVNQSTVHAASATDQSAATATRSPSNSPGLQPKLLNSVSGSGVPQVQKASVGVTATKPAAQNPKPVTPAVASATKAATNTSAAPAQNDKSEGHPQ